MTALAQTLERRPSGRAFAAKLRARLAREELSHCRLCPRHCGADRLKGNAGYCGAGAHARYFSAQTEVADELELIPTFAIALSGCNMRCAFCIFGERSWNSRMGEAFDPLCISEQAGEALAKGARTVMFLGGEPGIHSADMMEIVALLPDDAKLVWKTNGYCSEQSRRILDGIFDVWLVDYKFGNDTCALRLANTPGYSEVLRENLIWAREHSELIVRHLLMPGHIECCWRPVARWISQNLPGVKVNLRAGFWPAHQSFRFPELCAAPPEREAELAFEIAREYNLRLIE